MHVWRSIAFWNEMNAAGCISRLPAGNSPFQRAASVLLIDTVVGAGN